MASGINPQEAARSAEGGKPELFGISVARVGLTKESGYRHVVFAFDGREYETFLPARIVTRREVADAFLLAYVAAAEYLNVELELYVPASEAFDLAKPVFEAFGL